MRGVNIVAMIVNPFMTESEATPLLLIIRFSIVLFNFDILMPNRIRVKVIFVKLIPTAIPSDIVETENVYRI
jgi:hypothetical protein